MAPSRTLIAVLSLLLVLSPRVRAQDKDKDKDKASESAATVISAGDADALKAAMDRNATVEGTVSNATWSRSGSVFFINFKEAEDTKFSAVFFKKDKEEVEKGFDGDVAKAITGAKIQVTGKIISYPKENGHPEIVVSKPDQLKIVEKAEAASDEKKDGEKPKDKE